MEWLNYHHLYYFWTVARAGSISKAAQHLCVSSPAISSQLHSLEESLGEELFIRSGRTLTMSEMGRVVFSYADEIFGLGRELMNTVKERPTGRPPRLLVGVVDVLPKMIAHWLIEPALRLQESVRIVCREGDADKLVTQLVMHELDVVLSDVPINPNIKVKAYSHLLGECGTTFVATPSVAKALKGSFPESLHRAPMLLPTENSSVRRSLDLWFESQGIRPVVAGEFQDYALLRGRAGARRCGTGAGARSAAELSAAFTGRVARSRGRCRPRCARCRTAMRSSRHHRGCRSYRTRASLRSRTSRGRKHPSR